MLHTICITTRKAISIFLFHKLSFVDRKLYQLLIKYVVNMINPLQTTQLYPGIVSMRVASMLRSAEIFPATLRFVFCLNVKSAFSLDVCIFLEYCKLYKSLLA